ncbi:MAG: branched-chain amino acid ABC transporter permease [Myxococcota bacterium]
MIELQILINGLSEGFIAALLGLSFWLVYASVRVFHVAFAATYTIAPFVVWSTLRAGIPWPLAVFAGLGASVALAVGCEVVNHARLERRHASGDLHLIASLGTYIAALQAIAIAWGNEAKFLYPGAHPTFTIAGIIVTRTQALNIGLSSCVVLLTGWLLRRTGVGLRLRALSDNPTELALRGHAVAPLRMELFALSGAIAAVAAILTAYHVGFDPYGGLEALLLAVVATVIGGRGSFWGPVLGGLVLGVTRSLVVLYASPAWKESATFVLLTLFLLLRPVGLIGKATRLEAQK